jgi:hypothetical protein
MNEKFYIPLRKYHQVVNSGNSSLEPEGIIVRLDDKQLKIVRKEPLVF